MASWRSGWLVLVALFLGCDRGAAPADGAALTGEVSGGDVASAPDAAAAAADVPQVEAALPAPTRVTSVEGITEYRLGNGLRVLLFPDPSKTTLTVNVTYMVGSRSEGYGETGMAHLLEHMMFKGTPTHGDIWGEMKARGVRFNGTTDYDRTNYYETVTASDENQAWALGLEADRMIHSKIAAEDLASEFSVVRNEFETYENDPSSILPERMMSTAYLWHNYGKSPIGARSDIERVPVDNLREFYRKYYQPDNAVLVVAGKIDPDKTLAQVNELFGRIARPERQLPTSYTIEPVQDGEREVVLRRNGDTQVVGVLYHGVAGSDDDFAACEALAHLLTAEPSGRLYQALVKTGLATRVWSRAQPLAEPGNMMFFADVPAGKPIEPVETAMLAEVEGFADARRAPTSEEIERFKADSARAFDLLMTNSQEAAIALTEWQALGDWRLMFLHRDRVASLDPARVGAFAAHYLKPANRTLGLFIPDKAPDRSPMPGRPDVTALIKDYQGKAAAAEGEAFEASVANIDAKTIRAVVGGLKLALLPKATRGGVVNARMVLRFGTPAALKGRTDAGDGVTEMLMRGTTEHTFQQLKDELARLKAEVQIQGSGLVPQPGVVTVRVQTTRENLAAVMALVAEILQKPSFPADQFEIMRGEMLTALNQQLNDPQALSITAAVRKLMPLPKDDLRYTPTIAEAIERVKALTLDEVRKFHADFYGASNGEAAFVGDFDPAELQKLLTEHFGAWASKSPFERVPSVYVANLAGEEVIDTPDKEGAFIVAVQAFPMKDDDPDYPALLLTNYIAGGGGASRLNNRLRQKEGWSYGAFSQVIASPLDAFGVFVAGALVNPQNAPKAMKALLEEMQLLLDKGVPADELDTVKKAWANAFQTRLADDGQVADKLVQGLFIGRTLAWDKAINDKIAALTGDDLKALYARGPLKVASFGTVIASDQKKAAAAPEPAPK